MRGSGASVGKVTELGGSLCLLVPDMVGNGAIAHCVVHTLCGGMIMDGIGRILGV